MQKKKMSSLHPKDEKEIVSLNDNLFNEFQIEELEVRFETDPMMLTNLFNLGVPNDDLNPLGCGCKKIGECPNLTCGCDGGYQQPPVCPELNCSPVACSPVMSLT